MSVLLGVPLAQNRFKVGVDDERCAVRVTDLFEFDVSLLTLCSGKHLHNRHEVFTGANPLMFGKRLFCIKTFETPKAYTITMLMLVIVLK